MVTRGWTTIILAMVVSGTRATAVAPKPISDKLFDGIAACQALTEADRRLQCYDRTVTAFDAARRSRNIVIIDRAQIHETRKTLFGLTLPKIAIFDQNQDGKPDTNDITQMNTTISDANIVGQGQWRIVLADGAIWLQTDDNVVARRPRAGDPVIIKRGSLGSFKMSVAGQPAIKVKRQQ